MMRKLIKNGLRLGILTINKSTWVQIRKFSKLPLKNVVNRQTGIFVIGSTIAGYLVTKVQCEQEKDPKPKFIKNQHLEIRDDLPYFRDSELALHDNKYHIKNSPGVDTFDIIGNSWEIERENRIWVSYGVGVYDITDLIEQHKVPEYTIMLAAGMPLDPFWRDRYMAEIHNNQHVHEMLEKCRIGNYYNEENED